MPLDGAAIRAIVIDAAKDTMKDIGDAVKSDANQRIGRVDPSEDPTPALQLRNSARSRTTSTGAGLITVTLTWGRPGGGWHGLGTAGYAVVQHERMDLAHPRGGQPKYATAGLRKQVPYVAPELAAGIRARLG